MNRPYRFRHAWLLLACLTVFLTPGLAAEPQPPSMRLTDEVQPLSYAAELTVVPDSEDFSGRITIDIAVGKSLDFFWLNAKRLSIANASLAISGERLEARIVAGGSDFIGLQFPHRLAAGRGQLTLIYSGKMSRSNTQGLFTQKDGGEWYAFSQLEPNSARQVFPSFDEPRWKTPWTLSLVIPQAHVAVSNTMQVGEDQLGQGMKRIRFAPTRPLPSYLVALGVGPFDVVDGGTAGMNKIPLRYFTPKGRGAETAYAVKVTPEILRLEEEYFGRAYPFEKLDSLAIPVTVNFGAMENAGLITYRASLLMARPGRDDERFRQAYVSVGAHEIAHQWFGNLVTMQWWNDVWLNESFATWMARKTVEKFNPAQALHGQRETERQSAMNTDRLAGTRQIRQPVNDQADLTNAFDRITYAKGGAVLTMFESWLGADAFRDGVRRYLKQHEYGNATAEDFFAALAASNKNLATGFASFVEQPGLPKVDLALECGGAKPAVRISQSRFLPGASDAVANRQTWTLPVCLKYQGQKTDQPFCTLVTEKQVTVSLPDAAACPAWVLPNPSGDGYYLSSMSRADILKLPAAPLSATEVASVFTDLTLLSRSTGFPQNVLLELVAAYAGDARPEVVKAAVDAVLSTRPGGFNVQQRAQFGRWVTKYFGASATALGWMTRDTDSDATRKLRLVLVPMVALYGTDPALRNEARALTMAWLNGGPLPPLGTMLGAAVRVAAQSGDKGLFDALVANLARAPDGSLRAVLYGALGSLGDSGLLEQAMDLVFAERLDAREAQEIVNVAALRPEHAAQVQHFVSAHYDKLLARLPENFGANLPRLGSSLCSPAERNEFARFYGSRAEQYPGGSRNLKLALNAVDICIANQNMQQAGLQQYLSTVR